MYCRRSVNESVEVRYSPSLQEVLNINEEKQEIKVMVWETMVNTQLVYTCI